jgi:hypothetical protein
MKTIIWSFSTLLVLASCNSAEITEVSEKIENDQPLVNEFVPPALQKIDTSTILTLIHYLERNQETTIQNKIEIQKLKDSINYDAILYFQRPNSTIGRDGKIATH